MRRRGTRGLDAETKEEQDDGVLICMKTEEVIEKSTLSFTKRPSFDIESNKRWLLVEKGVSIAELAKKATWVIESNRVVYKADRRRSVEFSSAF